MKKNVLKNNRARLIIAAVIVGILLTISTCLIHFSKADDVSDSINLDISAETAFATTLAADTKDLPKEASANALTETTTDEVASEETKEAINQNEENNEDIESAVETITTEVIPEKNTSNTISSEALKINYQDKTIKEPECTNAEVPSSAAGEINTLSIVDTTNSNDTSEHVHNWVVETRFTRNHTNEGHYAPYICECRLDFQTYEELEAHQEDTAIKSRDSYRDENGVWHGDIAHGGWCNGWVVEREWDIYATSYRNVCECGEIGDDWYTVEEVSCTCTHYGSNMHFHFGDRDCCSSDWKRVE